MLWNKHSNLEGKHATLGASKFTWLNYDQEKLISTYANGMRTTVGTFVHDFAARRIMRFKKLPKNKNQVIDILETYLDAKDIPIDYIKEIKYLPDEVIETLIYYVNDAIAFRMDAEKVLYFSDNCFGTADSISYKDGFLRIHDLKTGSTPAHIEQLEIYAALFCWEYKVDPHDIQMELRLYQNGEIVTHVPDPNDIQSIMNIMVDANNIIETVKNNR